MFCAIGITTNLVLGLSCQRGRSSDQQVTVNSETVEAPGASTGFVSEILRMDASVGDVVADGGAPYGNEDVFRCVANEEDVVSFLWSLPESDAQSAYARAHGKSDRDIKAVLEHYPSPGCGIYSKYEPFRCDWVLLVRGPLFSARYQIHPTRRQVDMVDALSYADSCTRRRAEFAQWWPKDIDCSDILKQTRDNISSSGGKCLPER